ncbi:MAG: YaaA family protein [Spirochaetales bacterium]|uniref:UPF0246 protein PQJ61_02900 n=1 Tax=Candidatus Thalassospirochaeta sargassi TaxID=3119039 RepID=A0AAJ1MLG8_9SPIO|nr:YaaA family protein [Spirochaetales bacterium]
MIILLSPTKQMDFDSPLPAAFKQQNDTGDWGLPRFSTEAAGIMEDLSLFSRSELETLMQISPAISAAVIRMISDFSKDSCTIRPAITAYSGTVFKAMNVATLEDEQLLFAENRLRILSGLYGVLKPFDGIKAYRLEMKTPLCLNNGEKLSTFWRPRITAALASEKDLSNPDEPILNLASGEYMKAVDIKKIHNPVISIHFRDIIHGKLKTVGMYSKVARGKAVRLILEHKINRPEQFKSIPVGGYNYNSELSTESELVFIRREDG